jgi:hypothetical protein
MADNLTTFKCRLSRNLGASASWNPKGLSRPVMGLLYLYLYPLLLSLYTALILNIYAVELSLKQQIYISLRETMIRYTHFNKQAVCILCSFAERYK